jgi:hypothetical protein
MRRDISGGLMSRVTLSAKRRWLTLVAGLALLAGLFAFAGMIRTEGARKNPWTVLASRVLVVAAGFMFGRIVLLTHEDGVPVFYISAGARGGGAGQSRTPLEEALEIAARRFELVPLSDVMQFIRDHRYVPPKGAGLVIGVRNMSALREAKRALAGTGAAGLKATLLVDEACLDEAAGTGGIDLPAGCTLAVRLPGEGLNRAALVERLGSAREAALRAAGCEVQYVMLEDESNAGSIKPARDAGVQAVFGGEGLNRYGDSGYRVRLMDLRRILAARRGRETRLRAYSTMYRGNYLPYPVWLWLNLTAPMPAPSTEEPVLEEKPEGG